MTNEAPNRVDHRTLTDQPKRTVDHFSIIRDVPYMGVIWVVDEASKLGFRNLDPDWCNFGQGQPEVGELPGAPPRLSEVSLQVSDFAYGPVGGINELRDAIAAHYNRLFRKGKKQQYSRENVAIAAGGRLVLSRLLATLGTHNLGHLIPDYTAYEDLLHYHVHRIRAVPLQTNEDTAFHLHSTKLAAMIAQHNLRSFLFSNPCNPTGNLVQGDELAAYIDVGRRANCWLLADEFYSHFVYDANGAPGKAPVSAAAFVEDVDADPVIIVDGLTKNFRYPGLRIGWAVGPSSVIGRVARAASAIDGGPPVALQRAAVQVLAPDVADQETNALRSAFARKRNLMLSCLRDLGVRFENESLGTFYLWGNVRGLPAGLQNADMFFRAALQHKVMTVPGRFFDVNPGAAKRPPLVDDGWVRFSFGPPESNIRLGLDRLTGMIRNS
jgi:aspartate/methionine/tyrosine aminotransferase